MRFGCLIRPLLLVGEPLKYHQGHEGTRENGVHHVKWIGVWAWEAFRKKKHVTGRRDEEEEELSTVRVGGWRGGGLHIRSGLGR